MGAKPTGAGRPRTDRPRGGYWDTDDPPRLRWSWAVERFEGALNYWVVATRPDGRPYARPVWGLWFEGGLTFESASLNDNLRRDARVEVHLESGDEVVIITGQAEPLDARKAHRWVRLYNAKYAWDWDPKAPPALIWIVRPRTAFGWISRQADHGTSFARSGTRWSF